MYNDNKSLSECIESTTAIKDKRMFITVAGLRSMKTKDSIQLHWIEGDSMAADALTKQEHLLMLMNESKLYFIPHC